MEEAEDTRSIHLAEDMEAVVEDMGEAEEVATEVVATEEEAAAEDTAMAKASTGLEGVVMEVATTEMHTTTKWAAVVPLP